MVQGRKGPHTHTVRAYSDRHKIWVDQQGVRERGVTTMNTSTLTGSSGRPPDGNIGVHSTPIDNQGNISLSYTANRQ